MTLYPWEWKATFETECIEWYSYNLPCKSSEIEGTINFKKYSIISN